MEGGNAITQATQQTEPDDVNDAGVARLTAESIVTKNA